MDLCSVFTPLQNVIVCTMWHIQRPVMKRFLRDTELHMNLFSTEAKRKVTGSTFASWTNAITRAQTAPAHWDINSFQLPQILSQLGRRCWCDVWTDVMVLLREWKNPCSKSRFYYKKLPCLKCTFPHFWAVTGCISISLFYWIFCLPIKCFTLFKSVDENTVTPLVWQPVSVANAQYEWNMKSVLLHLIIFK